MELGFDLYKWPWMSTSVFCYQTHLSHPLFLQEKQITVLMKWYFSTCAWSTFDSWETQSANKAKGGTSFCPIGRWWDWLFPHQPVIWNIDAGNKARTMSWVNGHRCVRRGRIHSESYSSEVKVRYKPSESSKIMSFQIGRCLEHLSWDILAKKFRCFRWHRNQGKLLIWIKTWGKKGLF